MVYTIECVLCKVSFSTKGNQAKYCPSCRRYMHSAQRREADARRRERLYKVAGAVHHGVRVIYRDGLGEDHYSKTAFSEYLRCGAFKPGDRYNLNGEWYQVS
jgi:hypothetical protein